MTEQENPEETSEPESATPDDSGPAGAAEQAEPGAKKESAPADDSGAAEQTEPEAKKERPGASKPPAAPAGPDTAVVVPRRVAGTSVVSRRRVLLVGFWASLGAVIAGTAAAGVGLVYPKEVAGFGGKVAVDPGDVPAPGGKSQIGSGRFWLANLTEEQGGPGLLALWWKCPHLGCTVPWVPTFTWPDPTTGADKLGWFRCPCHGSTYTDAGVRVFGPAPRSLDTMAITVEGGRVTVDTGSITPGTPDNSSRATRL